MDKFCEYLTELSAQDASVFSFLDDNLSKYQCIFTKLSVHIDTVEICFGIAYWQISSIFDRVVCPQHLHILVSDNNFSKFQWIFTKFDMCIDIVEIWFGIAHWQILLLFQGVVCL